MEKLYIVKVGGKVIDDAGEMQNFLTGFSQIKGLKILVHGGGKIASEVGKLLGVEQKIIDGRRITDAETLKLVTMVYAGLINKNIVAQLQSNGCNAIGLTGADCNIIPARKRKVEEVDYGFAGDVNSSEINTNNLILFLNNQLVPVIAPLTHDARGNLLNTNADTIAANLAIALSKFFKTQLVFCFEKQGVLEDVNNADSFMKSITAEDYLSLKEDGVVSKGMIPKMDSAFSALKEGVQAVRIGHSCELSNIINNKSAGTELSL